MQQVIASVTDCGLSKEEVEALESTSIKLQEHGVYGVEADFILRLATEQKSFAQGRSEIADQKKQQRIQLLKGFGKYAGITVMAILVMSLFIGLFAWALSSDNDTPKKLADYESKHTLTAQSSVSIKGWQLNNDKAAITSFAAQNKPPDVAKTTNGYAVRVVSATGEETGITARQKKMSDGSSGVALAVTYNTYRGKYGSENEITEDWVLPIGQNMVLLENPKTGTKNYFRFRQTQPGDENSPLELALWNAK